MTCSPVTTVSLRLLALVLTAISVSAADADITTVQLSSPMVIDGRFDDWPAEAGKRFSKEHVGVTTGNDSTYLYVVFRTADPRWVRAIKMTGLTLYLNADGKKKKDFYLRFVGGPPRDVVMALMKNRPERRLDRAPRDVSMAPPEELPLVDSTSFTCYIKDRIEEKPIPLDGSEGPAVAFDTSQGFFTYEFRIPLEEGAVRYYGFGATPGSPIALGFLWGDMSAFREEHERGGPQINMGGPEGGPVGSGRGSMGGGPGNGPGGPMGDRPEKQELWLKTSLAAAP